MRSLKLSIIIILFASSFVGHTQQNPTKSSVTTALKQGFVQFVDNVRPFYTSGDTYTDFKQKALLGVTKPGTYTLPPVPNEGESLLQKAYQFLVANYSSRQMFEKADYKGYGKAILYINNYAKDSSKNTGDAEVALFGGNELALNNNPFMRSTSGKCKWWQIWCHIDQIFGPNMGGQILQAIITFIINLL